MYWLEKYIYNVQAMSRISIIYYFIIINYIIFIILFFRFYTNNFYQYHTRVKIRDLGLSQI